MIDMSIEHLKIVQHKTFVYICKPYSVLKNWQFFVSKQIVLPINLNSHLLLTTTNSYELLVFYLLHPNNYHISL
jgi:hypothetical protein